MIDITKSVLSASWALSLFSVKQVMNMVTPGQSVQGRQTAEAFDAATQAAGADLDEMTHSVFAVGDELQREIVDLIASSMTVRALNPLNMLELPIMRRSTDTLRAFMPGKDSQVLVQELKNKFTVFNLVKQVPITLDLPTAPPFPPLADIIKRAMALEEYPRLWVIEGLGHYHGDTFWKRNAVPLEILSGEEYQTLPASSQTMLNAGIGMAFAQHLMKTVNHLSPAGEIRQVLKEFIQLCRDNARPGYEGAALESLGLITRHGMFYGDTQPARMVRAISDELAQLDPEVYGYFWHGVGRATYFLPINFIPGYGSIGHAADMIRHIAPDETALRNAIAGLAWGVTMVNIRNPEIMENWISLQRETLTENDALTNGVLSGIMMRQDTTPGASFIKAYYEHTPDPSLQEVWDTMVRRPVTQALEEVYPVLVEKQRLGEIFRYQSLTDLVQRLTS
ncbi:MAG: hypothetical protein FJY97_02135 [candidate division Zixibacteria bacterium]|nr:hypothetical protein [candidate division Zixibacteria bacterium]